ncbi:hypothetical protein F503_08818 [Ophiostoma piceae UAMH 11346]|uniref:Uncharacterized protein n=1 Tax=Ophiostoma piceae (strain UAMH 11346) TaxID=1262450 RepID=S3BU28_OPHP1|nr:hypothetical protein F503_08818 [Ophiostoma piceae UAMH 11346]
MSFLYGNTFAMPQAPLQSHYVQAQPQQQHYISAHEHDAFYQDISRQLAAASASSASSSTIRRRHSRSSQSAMRIVKPSSANNSPTSSIVRRRMPPSATMAARPARPVSWHPSSSSNNNNTSYLMPQYQPQPHHYFSANTPLQADDLAFPSSTYSNQTSPSTAFSPYLSTYEVPSTNAYSNAHAQSQYYSPNPWALSPSTLPVPSGAAMFDKLPSPDCPPLINLPPSLDVDAELELELELDAQDREEVFRQQQEQCRQQVAAMHRMHNMQTLNTASSSSSSSSSEYAYAIRAPRTPPMCTLNSEPAAVAVSAAPEDDTDGEILVGMGLYDPPEKSFQEVDPTLQSYRSSVAQLLGAAYTMPTPTGKGLKLEDSWEPPENMDDEDEDDDERDAEGEDQ